MTDALQSKDGKFLCTPEHAVEVAYMLSNAEAVVDRIRFDYDEVGRLIVAYLAGDMSVEEVQKEFVEWLKDLEPVEPKEPSK